MQFGKEVLCLLLCCFLVSAQAPTYNVSASVGQTINLDCSLDEVDSTHEILWLFNGYRLDTSGSDKRVLLIVEYINQRNLRKSNINQEDAGIYICLMPNTGKTIASYNVVITNRRAETINEASTEFLTVHAAEKSASTQPNSTIKMDVSTQPNSTITTENATLSTGYTTSEPEPYTEPAVDVTTGDEGSTATQTVRPGSCYLVMLTVCGILLYI